MSDDNKKSLEKELFDLENMEDTQKSVIVNKAESDAMLLAEEMSHLAPEVCYMELGDDYEVTYNRSYAPLCKVCNHTERDKIESAYIYSNFNISATYRWAKENNMDLSQSSIGNHMRNHCDFSDRVVNFLGKLKSKEKELAEIGTDRLQWCMDVISLQILELGSYDTTSNLKQANTVIKTTMQAARTIGNLEKIRSDIGGATARAQTMIDAEHRRIAELLKRIMGIIDDKQKEKVIEAVREFQRGGVLSP